MNRLLKRASRLACLTLLVILGFGFYFPLAVSKAPCATFTVTNTNNAGAGSLPQAIANANGSPGPHTINFAIPPCDPAPICTIQPTSTLTLTRGDTTIAGYTQPGSARATASTNAVPMIQINGSAIAGNCLAITSPRNVVEGLVLNRCNTHGVNISGPGATGNRLSGNFIGTNFNGLSDGSINLSGIFIGPGAQGNIIGGSGPADRNLISGNGHNGIEIRGAGTNNNVISGNYIGTFVNGNLAMPNVQNGIRIYDGAQYNIIGGDTAGHHNLISGNGNVGILIEGAATSNNTVSGNFIGTDAGGTASAGNTHDGIYLTSGAHHNTIGGATPENRNVISGNQGNGVSLSVSTWNTVSGNYIGTDATGMNSLPNQASGILISNSSYTTIGGGTSGERNVISGNEWAGINLYAGGTPTTFNSIVGNYIGLAKDGQKPLPNQEGIIFQGNVNLNTVGGSNAGQRNVISGNLESGIYFNGGPQENTISGNYIGTDASGQVAVGNGGEGMYLSLGASNNLIGGNTPGSGNIISGNRVGIWIGADWVLCSGNYVKGNFIGTDHSGIKPIGNLQNGIQVSENTQANFIGPDNRIAFNGGDGVGIDTTTATANFITHNYIFGNSGLGINLTNGANGDIPAPAIQNTTFASPNSIHIAVATCGGCGIQVFNSRIPDGEGETYLGGGLADGAGNYVLEVFSLPYPNLTATATDVRGTSEFSPPFTSTAYLTRLPLIRR